MFFPNEAGIARIKPASPAEWQIMAQKRLNKNLVVALSLATFAGIFVLSVLMIRQLQQNDPKYFVELAERAAAEGQWKQAALFYGQAWDRSGDHSYLVPVGEMLLNEGEVGQAREAWNQALVHQPGLIAAHEKRIQLLLDMAELYGRTEHWSAVSDTAAAMISADVPKSPEQEAFALHARGLALVNLTIRDEHNAERGLADLEKAAELAPRVARYAIDVAAEYERQRRPGDAETLCRSLLERFAEPGPSGSEARLALAGFLARKQEFDQAESMFQESVAFAGDDARASSEARLAYSSFLMQRWARARMSGSDDAQAYFDRSEEMLRKLIADDPDDFRPYLQIAILKKASANFNDVVSITEERLRRGLSRRGLKAQQNRVNAFLLMIHASEACVALGLQAGKTGDIQAKDDWLKKAEQYVVDARGEAGTHPRVSSQSGRVKLARGQDRAALEDLREADEAYRSFGTVNWENKLILADTHMRLNEPGSARSVLESVIDVAARDRPRDPTFWNLYAQSLFRSDELDRALAVTDRVLIFDPNNADAKTIKAAVYERQGKHELAGSLTGSPAVNAMLRARAATMDGNSDEALKILQNALEEEPSNVRLLAMIVNELVNRDRHDEAMRIVQTARGLLPDDNSLAQLAVYARPDLSDEQRDQAMLEAIQAEDDEYKRSLDLVMHYSRRSDFDATLKAIDDALERLRSRDTPMARTATSSQHAALLKTKIRIAAQLDDKDALDKARDEAAKYNVDGAGGKSILGLYHMQRGEIDLAVNALREAVAAQPSDAMSLTLLGQCHHTQGRYDEARRAYEQAVAANKEFALAHQGLAAVAKARGDEETFLAELAICERLSPDDPWVKEQVLIRTEEKDPVAAIARREAAEQSNPDDVYNLQRLASLYEKVIDLPKADRAYDQLRDLRPDDERVALLAAQYFRRTNRGDRAIERLTRFAESRTGDDQRERAYRMLASEYLEQGNIAAAEKTLLSIATDAPSIDVSRALADFYLRNAEQPAKALEWYDRAFTAAEKAKSPLAPALLEARIVARLHRLVNDFDGAQRDVERLRLSYPDHARGSLWESEIHARQGNISEAVASLSAYLSDRPDDTYALYSRARYRVSQGSVGPAIADLETIKRTAPLALGQEPRLLLATLYRRTGRNDLWVRELESLATESPQSAQAAEELVRAYIRLQRFDDADRLVTARINRQDGEAKGRWYFLRGQISVELGQLAKALRDFEQGAELDGYTAAGVSSVLALAARAEEYARGIAFFEGVRSRIQPSAVAGAHNALLLARAGRTDDAVDQFRQSMAVALTREPAATRTVADNLQAAFPANEAVSLFSQPPSDAALRRANDRLLVRIHAVSGNFDKAVALLDALIASSATDAERAGMLHEKGTTLQLAGRHDEAITAYEQAIEYDRNNWVALNNLAYVLSDEKGENQRALAYAQRAVALTDNAFTLDTLGWIYVGLRQYAPAVAELSRAVRVDPDYGWAYYHLGEAHRRAGQLKDAADVLKTGRDVAQATGGDAELLRLIDESADKVTRGDAAP